MNRSYFICNVFDDATKIKRGITTDSPAASKKVFSLCSSLILNNVNAVVISLGRGSSSGSGKFFKAKISRVNSVPTIFLPYWDAPLLSNLTTLFTLPFFIFRLNKKSGNKTYIFYNRLFYYLPALVVAFVLKCRTFLDLEDGDMTSNRSTLLGRLRNFFLINLFDFFCKSGAILACGGLGNETRITKKISCYGTSDGLLSAGPNLQNSQLNVMFGGSVSPDTGADLLISAINLLRNEGQVWVDQLCFLVTGKGSFGQFQALSKEEKHPRLHFLGTLTKKDYQKVLKTVHIGLSLKPVDGAFSNTTFPSKVIEYSSNKVLVISTNISDTQEVLSNGAIYLDTNNPEELCEKLKWIVNHRQESQKIAQRGFEIVNYRLSKKKVGAELKDFLFGANK